MQDIRLQGGGRVRIGPWRGSSDTAMMSLYVGPTIEVEAIHTTLQRLSSAGYHQVVTAAVADRDRPSFEAAGFSIKRQLHLLSRPLDDLPQVPTTPRLRTARRWERDEVLELDQSAFDEFWAFDEMGLVDAISATPTSRIRVTRNRPFSGYALSGVAGGVGYLQRLAVAPGTAGQGFGSTLVLDALAWMRRRGGQRAYVNTQVENERALSLYLRHGFRRMPERLYILERSLITPSPTDQNPR